MADDDGALDGFLQFMEVAPDAMVCVDKGGIIVRVNTQAEALFGHARDALYGKPIEALIPQRYRGAHVPHRDGFVADPHMRPMGPGLDLFALKADGTEFPVEVSLSPVKLSDHEMVVASIRDTSERVRAERRFRSLLESAPDAMVIVNEEGSIVLVNAQAQSVFGYGREQLLEMRVEDLIPTRYRSSHEGHRGGFFQAPHARAMGSGLDLFALRKDGTEFPVEISLSPIETEEGRLVAAAVRDVTERKDAEAKAQQAAEQEQRLVQLQELDDFRTRFINAAAHELNTPLTPIGATLKILERDDIPAENADRARVILRRNFDRLERLVHDLLDAGRFQSGRLEIEPTSFDLVTAVTYVVESFQAVVKERSQTLRLDAPATLKVEADEARLGQVLDNLLSNANKFTPPGGSIIVRILDDAEGPAVEVTDTGAGFTQEQRDRLFTPFVRLHEGIAPGTGLGLYVSHGILAGHGGTLEASSPGPGKGATFRLRLPGAT